MPEKLNGMLPEQVRDVQFNLVTHEVRGLGDPTVTLLAGVEVRFNLKGLDPEVVARLQRRIGAAGAGHIRRIDYGADFYGEQPEYTVTAMLSEVHTLVMVQFISAILKDLILEDPNA